MSSLPVVVCGRTPAIAKVVRQHLLPEYDVTHIILNPASGKTDIPFLLRGLAPPNHSTNLGSQNYSQIPVAIVTGGGYDDEAFNSMRNACKGVEGVKKVPWLRPDSEKPLDVGNMQAFGEGTARRVKVALQRLGMEEDVAFY